MTKFSSAPVIDDAERDGEVPVGTKVGLAGSVVVGAVDQERNAPKIEVVDMSGASVEEVETKLNEVLAGGSAVLHGSGESENGVIEEFDPLRSNLAGKKSSIYATDDPETAIFNAVLDKRSPVATALRILDGGEGASSKMNIRKDGVMKFQIPEHMANAIQEALSLGPESPQWKALFRDGVVYVLPKDKFSQDSPRIDGVEESTDHEWNSQEKVVPDGVIQVSSKLITDVLRFNGEDANVEIVTVDDEVVVSQFAGGMMAAIPEGSTEFGADDLLSLAGGSEERLRFAELVREKLGSDKLPVDEFVGQAAEIYREMILERAKA